MTQPGFSNPVHRPKLGLSASYAYVTDLLPVKV